MTITANVSDTTIPASIPTGTVQFTDNGSNLGSAVALVNGVATDNVTSGLSVGANNLVAIYSGRLAVVQALDLAGGPLHRAGRQWFHWPGPAEPAGHIPAGTLTISTPYTSANPFNSGTPVLINGGSEFQAIRRLRDVFRHRCGRIHHGCGQRWCAHHRHPAGDAAWTASARSPTSPTAPVASTARTLPSRGVKPVYISGNALQANDVATNDVTSAATTGSPYPAGASGSDGL